jgi:hypothetical protein
VEEDELASTHLGSNVGTAWIDFQIDRFWTNAFVAARHAICFALNFQANFIEIAEDFVFDVQNFPHSSTFVVPVETRRRISWVWGIKVSVTCYLDRRLNVPCHQMDIKH